MPAERPAITVLCVLAEQDAPRAASLFDEILAQREVTVTVVVIDGTRHGIAAREGITIVRRSAASEGEALRAALPHVHTEWVAWWDPCAHALPNRLARTLEWLAERPGVELATTAYFVSEGEDRYLAQVDPGAMGMQPGAWWTSGVVVRATRLGELVPWVGFPARLSLYRQLLAEGRVAALSTPLFHVPASAYIPEQGPAQQRAITLDQPACHVEESAVTVISFADRVDSQLYGLLASITAQRLPDGAIRTVIVDRSADGAVQRELRGASLPGPLQVLWAPNGGFATVVNQALATVETPLVAFVGSGLALMPSTLLAHLQAHRQHTGSPAVVLGSVAGAATSVALDRVIEESRRQRDEAGLVPGQLHVGTSLRLHHVSMPLQAIEDVGGFDERFLHPQGADQDLGLRLETAGLRVFFHPRAVVTRTRAWTLDAYAVEEQARAAALVPLLDAHPDHISATVDPATSRASCEQALEACAAEIGQSQRAAEALGSVDLDALSDGFEADRGLAEQIRATLTGHLAGLARAWAHAGTLEGLRRSGLSSMGELLHRHPVTLAGATGRVTMACPHHEDDLAWRTALACFLERTDAEEDASLVLLALDVSAPTLLRGLRDEVRRFRLHHQREPAPVVVVECQLPSAQWPRLVAAAETWLVLGGPRDESFVSMAEQAGRSVQRLESWVRSTTQDNRAPVPYPLSTSAAVRLLAWPDWSDPAALETLWDWVRPFEGRRDVAICLRHDPALDAPGDVAMQLLQQTFSETLGEDASLSVLIIDEVLDATSTRALVDTVDAALQLPGSEGGPRAALLERARVQLSTPGGVSRWAVRIEQADVPHQTPVLAHVG